MMHPRIQALVDQFGMSEQEAIFAIAVGLGIISGDVVEPGDPEGDDLTKAVAAALKKTDSQSGDRA
jgi:hypothetical protein